MYFKKFDIDKTKAEKRALVKNDNGITTAMTEMLGEKIIKQFHIFDELFPENIGYKKVVSKKFQKAGVDYEVYNENETLYIDIKVCVGPDYSMNADDFNNTSDVLESKAVPIEIYQNNVFTNTKGKLTDYMLYIIADNSGISYLLLSYEDVMKISMDHKRQIEYFYTEKGKIAKYINKGAYKWHTSNNGSGIYIKFPICPVKLTRVIIT